MNNFICWSLSTEQRLTHPTVLETIIFLIFKYQNEWMNEWLKMIASYMWKSTSTAWYIDECMSLLSSYASIACCCFLMSPLLYISLWDRDHGAASFQQHNGCQSTPLCACTNANAHRKYVYHTAEQSFSFRRKLTLWLRVVVIHSCHIFLSHCRCRVIYLYIYI